jgi:IclR family mhp operon transcriptional activator
MSDAIRSVTAGTTPPSKLMNTRSAWTLAELVRRAATAEDLGVSHARTLEEEGFVQSPPGTHGLYRICSSVQDLASGITSESVLADIAAPIVIAGTKRLRWPLSVAVLDDCYMRVIFCGMPYSRLATQEPPR